MLVTYCILDLAQGVLNIGDAAEARKELMKVQPMLLRDH
jgi:hypothetical protein